MIRRRLAIAAVALAIAIPAAAQPAPKAAYDELCASCHKQPQRLAARLARTDDARAKLDEFLASHHARDAAKRAAVIDYLYGAK